jgi:HD-GYP domain-containing protein (c-di-GMP phosphodiesterase class II)
MKYAVAIGREMGLEGEGLENLRLASLLHDIGKIGVKESILMKPAKLLGYERRQVKQHPGIGARIIESIDNSHKIFKGVIEHHERWDGTGYPGRLEAGDISLEGRIIAVADTFDALTTKRPYRKGYSRKKAFDEIKNGASTQFDPAVVNAFISSFHKHPEVWNSQC